MLVISGPAAVGKTSVANEVSAQLRAADIAHGAIDTDALDDVYPVPDEQWRLTERTSLRCGRAFASWARAG